MSDKNFVVGMEDLKPRVNDTEYKRILAIGDIHGNFSRFMTLWNKLEVTDDDLIIFLGDLIEGEKAGENIRTVKWLMKLSERSNVEILVGNAEFMFISEFFDANGNFILRRNFYCYTAEELEIAAKNEPDLPQQIYNFFIHLKAVHKMIIGDRNYIFCHAGINPEKSLNKQKLLDYIGVPRKKFFGEYDGEDVIIVGHTRPKRLKKKLSDLSKSEKKFLSVSIPIRFFDRNILMVDTGGKKVDGFISCVDILSGEFWQSDDDENYNFTV